MSYHSLSLICYNSLPVEGTSTQDAESWPSWLKAHAC